jgi:hypothetical protein
MRDQAHSNPPLAAALSWTALLLAVLCLGFLGWYIPADRARYHGMFRDFGMKLPSSTALMLSIPGVVFPVVAGVVALGALAAQLLVRSKTLAAVVHLFVIACCCVAFVAYRETLFQPMTQLIEAISGAPAGR